MSSSSSSSSSFDLEAFCASPPSNDEFTQGLCIVADSVTQLNEGLDDLSQGLNGFFLLFVGAFVFMMQAGFAMLCAGSIRQKNVKNILLKNLLDTCAGAIGFFVLGFALAYGSSDDDNDDGGLTFVGTSNFALHNYDNYSYFFVQYAFAATSDTIVAGTVAERCKVTAYLYYSFVLTGFVYPVIAHSIWDTHGFLSSSVLDESNLFRGVGVVDCAGSGVVHMTGGVTALIAATVLGPRMGRFHDEDGNLLDEPQTFRPHSTALQIIGLFILWVGWYGFNPGATLAIDNANDASVVGLAAVTTTLSAAAGCITALMTDSFLVAMETMEVSYDLTMAMNGALGGLVSITAGCEVVTPWASILIGMIGGWVYLFGSKLLIRFRIDDAVDGIPVHLGCGFWGMFSVGLFANGGLMEAAGYKSDHQGWFYEWGQGSGDGNLLLVQICAILWIIGWVSFIFIPFFNFLYWADMFRVHPMEEEVGMDIAHHHGAAYDLTAVDKKFIEDLIISRDAHHGKITVPDPIEEESEETGDNHGPESAKETMTTVRDAASDEA